MVVRPDAGVGRIEERLGQYVRLGPLTEYTELGRRSCTGGNHDDILLGFEKIRPGGTLRQLGKAHVTMRRHGGVDPGRSVGEPLPIERVWVNAKVCLESPRSS